MSREENIEGLLNRFVDGAVPTRDAETLKQRTRLIRRLIEDWNATLHSVPNEGARNDDSAAPFPDRGVYGRLDQDQRIRMAFLVEELQRCPTMNHKIHLGSDRNSTRRYIDAILNFLSHLVPNEAPESGSEDAHSAITDSISLPERRQHALLQLWAEEEENENADWLRHGQQLESSTMTQAMDLFEFCGKENAKPIVHEPPLRLWDFITSKGIAVCDLDGAEREEDAGWNQRKLDIDHFSRNPARHPLLCGALGFANGVCHVTLDGSFDGHSISGTAAGHALSRPVLRDKEAFEKSALPVVLMALDGVLPAIQSLETASTLRRATALHKLLSKITRSGRMRHALDQFGELSFQQDPIQFAFLSAVQSILRFHSATLQSLQSSIRKRQKLDQPGIPASSDEGPISLIEAVLHTETLQRQTLSLGTVCGLDQGLDPEEARKKLPCGDQLLSQLYSELLEADNQTESMSRYLFCCCFQPFLKQMRKWLHSTDEVAEGAPNMFPEFLVGIRDAFWEAGEQLRVLGRLETDLKTESAIIQSLRQISELEQLEMVHICERLGDRWAMCEPGYGDILITPWSFNAQTETVPLPFQHNALHEVVAVMTQTGQERWQEVQEILKSAQTIRRIEREIADAKQKEALLDRTAQIEWERRKAMEQAYNRQQDMNRLLMGQKSALKEKATQRTIARTREIQLERDLMKQAAIKEHAEAVRQLDSEICQLRREGIADVAPMEVDQEDPVLEAQQDDQEMSIDSDHDVAGPSTSHPAPVRAQWGSPAMSIDSPEADIEMAEPHISAEGVKKGTERQRKQWGSEMESVESLPSAESQSDKQGDASLVPVSAVIDGCVIQPILTQHKCISHAFSVIFCEELKFVSVVSYLKKFYFSESGDWMAALIEKLFSHVSAEMPLNSYTLQSIFDSSIVESLYAQLEPCPHVTLVLTLMSAKEDEETLIDISSQQFISCFTLTASVAWPLSLVLTENSLEDYNTVFRMLMRVRQVRWWLDQIWPILNRTQLYDPPSAPLQSKTRRLRLWYQDALVLVTMLQNYIHHELNQSRWELFQTRMQKTGLSLGKIREVHEEYMTAALETCFQKSHTKRLRSMLESALQSIIDFCYLLKEPPRCPERHEAPLLSRIKEDERWEQLSRLAAEIKHRSCAFYKTLKYRANRGECTEGLYTLMSFNSYYTSHNA